VNRSIVVVSAMVVGLVVFGVGSEVVARETDDRSSTSGVPRHSANATKDDVQAEIHGKTVPGPSPCLKAVGRWSSGYGAIESLASVGDGRHLVVGRGTTLVVVDVGEPWAMTPVAELILPGLANHIVVDGGIAIIAVDRAGIVAIDVSDPAHPHITDTLDTPGRALRIAVSDGLAAVADSNGGLRLVDIGDSRRLQAVGSLETGEAVVDVTMVGRTVAFTDGDVHLVDATDSVRPEIVSSIGGGLTGLAMNGHHLIANIDGALAVLDVSDTAHPVTVIPSGFGGTSLGSYVVSWIDDVGLIETEGEGVRVVDVSVPHAPELRAHLMDVNPVSAATVIGPMLVAAWEHSLEVFALDLPFNPEWDRVVRPPAPARSVAVSGDLAVLGLEGSQVAVVDVSNPLQPALVGTLEIPGVEAPEVAIRGDFACAWSPGGGVVFIDLDDPAEPSILIRLQLWDLSSGGVALGEGYAVVAGGEYVRVFDLTDPQQPVLGDELKVGSYARVAFHEDLVFVEQSPGVKILQVIDGQLVEQSTLSSYLSLSILRAANDRLYLYSSTWYWGSWGGPDEFWVVDVSDPAHPEVVGSWLVEMRDFVPYGDALAVLGSDHYDIIEMSHPPVFSVSQRGPMPTHGDAQTIDSAPVGLGFGYVSGDFWVLDPTGDRRTADGSLDLERREASDVVLWGDQVVVADGDLTVFDVSDPGQPHPEISIETPGSANAVLIDGNRLVVADGPAGVSIFSGPEGVLAEGLTHVGTVEVGGDAVAVAGSGDIAYAAVDKAGLIVIDLDAGIVLTTLNDGEEGSSAWSRPRSVSLAGHRLYVGYASGWQSPHGLHVYDVSDPAQPVLLGSESGSVEGRNLAVVRDETVVSPNGDSFGIVDFSNPAEPATLATISSKGEASGVVHVDGHQFVFADGTGGVFLADLSDPENPRILRRVQTPGEATGLAVTEDFVYVADGSGGLTVLDRSLCPLPSEDWDGAPLD
jgi:hypothetical protein